MCRMIRSTILTIACLSFFAAVVPSAGAATVTLATCPAPSTSTDFNQDYGSNDFVLQCQLIQRSVTLKAHSIFIDGANGGSISTSGTGGSKLYARADTACTDQPGDPTADIQISKALIEDTNGNGGIVLHSCGNQSVDTTSRIQSAGAKIDQACYWAGLSPCTIQVRDSLYHANRISIISEGDLTLFNSTFQTIGPNDQQTYISLLGNVNAGSGCPPQPPPPSCVCTSHNTFSGGVESSLFSFAMQLMSFDRSCVDIAQNITMAALDTDPSGACNNRLVSTASTVIDLSSAEIRNDFGKTGQISITAHPAWKSCTNPSPNGRPLKYTEIPFGPLLGDGRIEYTGAILVDDGSSGGGPDPNKVSAMNGGVDAVAGSCHVTPTCVDRPIPTTEGNQPTKVADQVARSNHNVTGVPRCDS